MTQYDIAVIGGGMVGAALAIGLAKQGRRVVVVEGQAPIPFESTQAMDLRVSAISQRSVQLLDSLGAWSAIRAMRTCPYRRLETWDHPECRTRFHSDSLDLAQLGYIVENRVVQLGLWQEMANQPNITLKCPDRLASLELGGEPRVTLESGEQFDVAWVVGADGANSQVRQQAGIGITAWDYRQHCMLINVKTELPQQDITWQWFTETGPRSFLPLCGQHASLVWYDAPSRIRQLCALNKAQLAKAITQHFPSELGDIEVEQWGAFPLTRRHAQTYVKQRCILVGDAAHTINPLAGQGVNLGFKDVEVLLEVFAGKELADIAIEHYELRRRPDNLLMQTGMDLFYKGFGTSLPPVKLLRNAALKLADQAGPLKAQVLKYAVGLK